MDLNRFTQKAQQAVLNAQNLTVEYGHNEITPVHLLLALLQQTDGVVPEIVAQIGVRPATIIAELDRRLPLISEGGYLPSIDHSVPPDISFSNYMFYLENYRMRCERHIA